jgi:DMSO/TMAO reductase YedYZ heme-binding membrane subunit
MLTGSEVLVAATDSKALWYLTRSTGVVAIILLTATLVVGVIASVGWTAERWPRFLSQHVHRNLSLLCVGFVAIHVATTVGDGFVPIGVADAFIPFRSPYRPLWVGLGALTFDLLLAVLVTSGLRHRIGYSAWRYVHWQAYLCWPIAMLHGLGSGSDPSRPLILAIDAACMSAVVAAVGWRLATGRSFGGGRRVVAAVAAIVVTAAIGTFAVLGPLRPGWSRRAGTSDALLAQIAAKSTGAAGGVPVTSLPTTTAPAAGTTGTAGSGSVPAAPFTFPLTGTQTTSVPDSRGYARITLTLSLQDAASTQLTVVLDGAAVPGGGVSLSSGSVALGPYRGVVTALEGGTLAATLASPTPLALTIDLNVDQSTGALSGTVSGTPAAR